MSDDKEELVLPGLDQLDDPQGFIRRREASEIPVVDLPEILLEIAARARFTSMFTHVTERDSRAGDLATILCAVPIAEACNGEVASADVPVRRSRANIACRAPAKSPKYFGYENGVAILLSRAQRDGFDNEIDEFVFCKWSKRSRAW